MPLVSARNPIVDKLLVLASGNLDRLNAAVQEAAGRSVTANLADIVEILKRGEAHAEDMPKSIAGFTIPRAKGP